MRRQSQPLVVQERARRYNVGIAFLGILMTAKTSNISLGKPAASAKMSGPRKQFNSLVKKLDTVRSALARWHDILPAVNARVQGELRPVHEQLNERLKRMVMLLDGMFDHASLSKRDRSKLRYLVPEMAEEILDTVEDDEVEAILEKYADEDDDLDEEEALFRQTLDEIFGQFPGEDEGEDEREPAPAQGKPKSARKAAAEASREKRQQAEEAKLKQSSRDVFRKLASVLHPDREQDPAEKLRKTELMQRANAAYEKNDFLGLLELQLEVEPVDAKGLERLSEDQVKRYNKVLKRQIEEVEQELHAFEDELLFSLEFDPFFHPTPDELLNALGRDIEDLKERVAYLDEELIKFQDIKKLKAFLKGYRIPPPPDFDDMFF
jgi:hypothetical protein